MSKLETKKAAIYARVSLGATYGQDPMVQVNQLREYAKQRGFEVFDEYVDVCSGAREKRDSLQRLLKDAFNHRFSVLLVSALDRCSRSVSHMLSLVAELEHNGVSLVSLREQLDLSGPQGRLMLTILSALSAMERDILRDRVRTGMAMRKLAAEKLGQPWRCGRPPISKEMIQEVLRLRSAGCSLREIEKRLGRKISKSAIGRIIRQQGAAPGDVSQDPRKDRP